jgi:hypothetical protein
VHAVDMRVEWKTTPRDIKFVTAGSKKLGGHYFHHPRCSFGSRKDSRRRTRE